VPLQSLPFPIQNLVHASSHISPLRMIFETLSYFVISIRCMSYLYEGAGHWPRQSVGITLTPSAISILDCNTLLAVAQAHNTWHNTFHVTLSLPPLGHRVLIAGSQRTKHKRAQDSSSLYLWLVPLS
ncbi:unnamed protein product, partial [Laminaria digitata]